MRLLGQSQPGVAMGAVQQEPGAQLGLGVQALVRQGRRVQDDPTRQHRAALDQDELARDGHERADVAQPVRVERRERIQVRLREPAERHGQHVELARLDEREEQGERAFELGHLDLERGLGPAALAEPDGRAAVGRGPDGGDSGPAHRDPGAITGTPTPSDGHQLASSASFRSSPYSGSRGRVLVADELDGPWRAVRLDRQDGRPLGMLAQAARATRPCPARRSRPVQTHVP